MKRIQYKKGNLFDVKDPKTVLVHACNCRGVWGSGIATDFKRIFPNAFKDYEGLCNRFKKKLLGRSFVFAPIVNGQPQQMVGYLFTSYAYGPHKDPEAKILKNTEKAVDCLLEIVKEGTEIHSPKINAGKFAVPWEKTAEIVERALVRYPKIKWTVWEFNGAQSK
jgi:ADP-ribose 1''-phosphate phosphatase